MVGGEHSVVTRHRKGRWPLQSRRVVGPRSFDLFVLLDMGGVERSLEYHLLRPLGMFEMGIRDGCS